MIVVRYADDMVVGFQSERDARRFLGRAGAEAGPVRVAAGENRRACGLKPGPSPTEGEGTLYGGTERERLCGKLREVEETVGRMMHLWIQTREPT